MPLIIEHIDLFSDWIEIIKSELQKQGYNIDNIDDDKLSILYFTLQKKLIKPLPRKILKSDIFSCPNELQEGLNLLEEKIRNGEDLKPYLSKKLSNLNSQDGLLFDWGIYHLHLGTTLDSDGFIQRTGPLLYARFDDRYAYFINVLNHGAWTAQELIKIIHRNWPKSIESYRLRGVIELEYKTNDNDIKSLRNGNVNTLIEIEKGVVYMGPGGGITSSGDSIEAVLRDSQTKEIIKQLEKSISSDIYGFLSTSFGNDLNFISNEKLFFKLKKEDGKYYIEEINNNLRILLKNLNL